MKKIMMAAAALCCMMMSFSSCNNIDNPVETQPQEPEANVKMADAIKLHTAPQSFYKLDTKEVLPFYVVVYNSYKDGDETKFYNLAAITEVSVDGNMFTVDASKLADYGYIKLVPNTESNAFQDLLEIVEEYGAYNWEDTRIITLKNKYGETFKQEVDLIYLTLNEFEVKETVKLSDLENDTYVSKIIQPFKLFEWSFKRFADSEKVVTDNGISIIKIKEDGNLHIITDGGPSDEGEPGTGEYKLERNLTSNSEEPLPEGDGLLVNFRVKVELNVTE